MSNLSLAYRDRFLQLARQFNGIQSAYSASQLANQLCSVLADLAGDLATPQPTPQPQPQPIPVPRYYNPSPDDCDRGQSVYTPLSDGVTFVRCTLVDWDTDPNDRNLTTTAVLKRQLIDGEITPFPFLLVDWDEVFVLDPGV